MSGARQPQLPLDPKDRPRYTSEQLQAYFRRIRLPQKYLDSPVFNDAALARTKEHGQPLLQAIMRYHVASVPFENLQLHYSRDKTIKLSTEDVYNKIVVNGIKYGRGGYCFEHIPFFGTLLRSLGYDFRNCAGKVSRMHNPDHEVRETQGQSYDCWNHAFHLVRFDGEWYDVDVGMGAFGPTTIFPLRDGFETVSLPPRRIRLQWRSIPEHFADNDEAAPKMWCFDVCHNPSATDPASNVWIPTYCFTETEFMPQDYEMMSWFLSTHTNSIFNKNILVTRILMGEKIEELVGDITMFNDRVATTIEGKREVVKVLHSEEERISCLKEMFGIELTPEERECDTVAKLAG